MISKLEGAISLAVLASGVCYFARWETAGQAALLVLLVLGFAFAIRVAVRRSRGADLDEAWGRVPPQK